MSPELIDHFRTPRNVGELAPPAVMVEVSNPVCGDILRLWMTPDFVQPFALLQQRIGRKTLDKKILEDLPVVVLAYDLLEWQGEDWRNRPQAERRAQLEQVIAHGNNPVLLPSPVLTGSDWFDLARQREASRRLGVEGMMLKARDALYGVGRTKDMGVWWKWKVDPFSVDAVLIYAQRGHGRRLSPRQTAGPGVPGEDNAGFAQF
jgi:DNA ligase-1